MSGRRPLVKLRISSHKLMIEISRYNQTWKDNRHCPSCGSNLIKDKVHFLFRRPTYSIIRNNFYNKVKILIPNITQLPVNVLIVVVLKAIHQTTVEFVFPVVLENYFVQFSIRDF